MQTDLSQLNPYNVERGYCFCGCGERTPIAKCTRSAWGYRKGEPVFFLKGHAVRLITDDPLRRYVVDDDTGCWNWAGAVSSNGYGILGVGYAHRLLYEHHKGPIPEGMDLDHLCRNHRCVNPEHLEAVTRSENVKRGLAAELMNRCAVCNKLAPRTATLCRQCDEYAKANGEPLGLPDKNGLIPVEV